MLQSDPRNCEATLLVILAKILTESMASVREGSNKDATHALAFRVMRLTRPALKVEMPLKCDANDLWHGEDDYSAPFLTKGGDPLFSARSELSEPLDACGVSGMMVLPQAFGYVCILPPCCKSSTSSPIRATHVVSYWSCAASKYCCSHSFSHFLLV